MAGEPEVIWPTEDIPDGDRLFMRVHQNQVDQDRPMPVAFRNHGDGMSTDWQKYRSAVETQHAGAQPADRYGVVEMPVGAVRAVPDQSVVHTPDAQSGNRAHTDVKGEKTTEVRVKLGRLATWAIAPAVCGT